jgi:hypothetical protein
MQFMAGISPGKVIKARFGRLITIPDIIGVVKSIEF